MQKPSTAGGLNRTAAKSFQPLTALLPGLVIALVMLSCPALMATTYYSGATTGDPTQLAAWWDTTGGTGNHPADFNSGDTFVIQTGHRYTVPASTTWTVNAASAGTAATVQINSGGMLIFANTSSCGMALGGNLTRNGVITNSSASGSATITFTSNGAWTGSGDVSLGGSTAKISITVNSSVTLDATAMTGGFKLGSSNTKGITVNGTLNLGANTVNGNGGGNSFFTLGASGTLITANTSASGVPGIFSGFSATKITLPSTANYTFNGTSAQVTGTTANNATMPTTVNNLTVNNSAGLTLSQDTTVSGTLTLTAGKVTGNAILSNNTGLSGGSSTAYINGQLTVPFSTPSSASYTFPIGTASAYSPITLTSFSDSGSGTLTAKATASQNPNPGSGIDGSLYIARYWTLTASGFSSPTYNFAGTYVPSDIQNSADPNNLIVRKWNGSWTSPTSSSSVAYTVTGTGFSGSFGDFAAGQAQTTLPNLDSLTKSAITNTAATLGATLENDYSLPVSEYGIVWGTSPSPTTSNNKVQAGTTLAAPNAFTANVSGLPLATTIYYRAYAINSSGTGYSTNGSFLTLTNEPTTQSSAASVAARQNGNLFVSWTRGNGARCIVLVKSGSAVDANPVDGSSYTANPGFGLGSQIGSGNYVAYLGTGSSLTVTGLVASTTYYVAVYELNGSGGTENYLTASPATGSQTTVANPTAVLTWTGTSDYDWNNTANWDLGQVPDVGTPVIIPASAVNQPIYSNQMVAASVGDVTESGILTVNTNGFNSGTIFVVQPGGIAQLYVNTGGVVNATGNLAICSNGIASITAGGSVTIAGGLNIGSDTAGGTGGTGTAGSAGVFTNTGGFLVAGSTSINPKNQSGSSSRLVITGGTNSLGSVSLKRSSAGSGGYSSLGSEGLLIYGGTVTMSGLNVGGGDGNSFLTALIADGIVTNNGSVQINQGSSARGSRLLQTGGLFVVTNLVNPNPTVSGSLNVYSVTGGTNIVGGLAFGSGTGAGSVFFTNGAVMYVGSQGIVSNGAVALSAVLSGGSLLGAMADWTGSVALQLDPGTVTIKAADVNGTAHNITLGGALSGGGTLVKTGAGTLTLNTANTYGGATTISNGTLALGASGTLVNSSQINLGSGATFDASAAGGFTLGSGKTVSGSGTVIGAFTAGSGSTISPGNSTGTLTFSSGLTLAGNTIVNVEISPTTNDVIEVSGTLNANTGVNTVSITAIGGVLAPGTYTLIHYTGSLVGNINNFALVGAPGYLTNNTTAQAIQLVTTGVRAPASVVWVGNASSNNWDVLQHTNWLNGASLDSFVQGDTVLFDATGSAHPSINITDPVIPASVTVDATANYTFSGSGSIGGNGGLTKTNTGTLVILTTNSYTGPTIIGNGTLEVALLANGGASSGIGAANNNTNNLVFYSSALRYTGPTASTDHGAILNDAGGTVIVTNSSTILTDNGTFVGAGGLTKAGSGTLVLATANTHSGGTTVTNGVLQINASTSLGSGAFTNINATLKFGTAMTVGNVVDFEGNCFVDLNNSSGDIALDGAWTGTGTVTITNQPNAARTFTVGGNGSGGGNLSGFSGTLSMGTSSAFLRFNDGGGNPNLGSANMIVDMGTGSSALLARNGGITIDIGALRGGPATRVTGRGSGSAGTITYTIGALSIDSIFAGTITNSASDVAVNKVGTGKLVLSGTNTYTGPTSMTGGELQVNGAIVNSAITVAVGKLSGTGTIGAATIIYTELAPGSGGIGTLTFTNTLTLDGFSTNEFVVTSSGGASNHVAVTGTLVPNNSNIYIKSGTPLAAGTYTLFTYTTAPSGSFNPTPVFDVAPTGTASIVDNGSGQINLVITSTTGPTLTGMDVSNLPSGTVGISATNGTPNGFFAVLVSTNLTLPVANWTSLVTNQFDSNGNYTGTVSVNPTAPQQFLMLQQLP